MTTTIETAAILLDGTHIQRWQHRAVAEMVSNTDVDVEFLIVNDTDANGESDGLSMDDFSVWNLYRAYHRRFYEKPLYRERIHVSDLSWSDSTTITRCKPVPANGLGNELADRIIEKLRNVDVAIRFGFGILVGDALSAPAHGVLSFHHGDVERYRGRPGGFWEFVDGEESAAVTLQRLTEQLDGGEVVLKQSVDLTGAASWPAVLSRLFRASDKMLATGVTELEKGHNTKSPDTLGELNTNPSWFGMLQYAVRVFQKRIKYALG